MAKVLGGGKMPTIDETIRFIQWAHTGQVTKGNEPYWTHPVAVMKLLPEDATDDERHAALLHDVLEDTGTTADDLSVAGYSDEVIAMVQSVTRPAGEERPSYMDWIRNIASSGNKGAIRIKLADNQHNCDPIRVANLPPDQHDIVKRYERSVVSQFEIGSTFSGAACS